MQGTSTKLKTIRKVSPDLVYAAVGVESESTRRWKGGRCSTYPSRRRGPEPIPRNGLLNESGRLRLGTLQAWAMAGPEFIRAQRCKELTPSLLHSVEKPSLNSTRTDTRLPWIAATSKALCPKAFRLFTCARCLQHLSWIVFL